MVAGLVEHDRARVALVSEAGERTFGELDERSNRLLHGLRSLGLEAESHLAVLTGNSFEFFEVAAAAGHGGMRYVPVNWHLTAPEVGYVLADSGAEALVVDRRHLAVAEEAVAAAGLDPSRVLVIGGDHPSFASYEALLDASPADEPEDQTMGGPMFYTSGTTGHPKGVRSSSAAPGRPPVWPAIGAGTCAGLRMPVGGTQLLCGPAYHTAQWSWTVPPLFAGNRIVMRDRFDAAEVLDLIDEHAVTGVHLVPTQFIRLLDLPGEVRSRFDGSSLAAVWHGAAPCPPEVKRRMIEWWGPVVWEYYGGTEGGLLTMVSPQDWVERPGTVGRVVSGYDVEIHDEDGRPLPAGETGQIWFRRASGERFEYHNAPEKTAASRRRDLSTLGDVGRLDEDGYLYLSDRAIDLIISGGVNIYPAEVEHCLIAHPDVSDVAVIGVPNAEFGEEVKAVVRARDGAPAGDELAAALDAHARAHLAGFKVPRSYDFVDELPRLETGKLRKRELRERYLPVS